MWIIATLIASLAQTARNALQKSLVAEIGTIGATNARFLYGFPFALIFCLIVYLSGAKMPSHLTQSFYIWGIIGGLAQIFATALMLTAMKLRSFVVTTALIKTEPVLVALFGVIFLHDYISNTSWIAIFIATLGVTLISWKSSTETDIKSVFIGLISASCFAIAATSFRGGILSLDGVFYANANAMLVFSLGFQALIVTLWLLFTDKAGLMKLFAAWKPSLLAGFTGALGSQFWFIAFSLQTAALVRTLALIEVLFAQIISGTLFKAKTTRQEAVGLLLIVFGVAYLLLA
jgi:drug/metabolite transporter (DMT)-like permease